MAPRAPPSVSKVIAPHLKPYPTDAKQRRSYRRFLRDRGRHFSCGRQGFWPEDLLEHFQWWRNGRTSEEPAVHWADIKPKSAKQEDSEDEPLFTNFKDGAASDSELPLELQRKLKEKKRKKAHKRSKKSEKGILVVQEETKHSSKHSRKESKSSGKESKTSSNGISKTSSKGEKPAKTSTKKSKSSKDASPAEAQVKPTKPKAVESAAKPKGTPQRPTPEEAVVAPLLSNKGSPKPPWGLLLLPCHSCSLSYHLRCLNLKSFPAGSWSCPECREEEEAPDICLQCGFEGTLLICNDCPRTFHAQCLGIKDTSENFKCSHCPREKEVSNLSASSDKSDVSKLMADVMALCATAPPSHFLSLFATKLESIQRMEGVLSARGQSAKKQLETAVNEDVLLRNLSRKCDRDEKKRTCKLCGEFGHMHQDPVNQIHGEGLYLSETGISTKQLEKCRAEVQQQFDHLLHTVNILQLQDQLRDVGFDLIKTRHAGRYDFQIPAFSEPQFSFLNKNGPWMPLLRRVLGKDCQFKHSGCMLALPGAMTQPEHSDGHHLTESEHLPVHAVNVFIPFVELTNQNGCTEFAPTTHILGSYEKPVERIEVHTKAGNWLVFDYRLRHRGLANNSNQPRPLLYLTYAKPSWQDTANFSATRYPKLPEIPRALSREERIRRRDGAAAAEPRQLRSSSRGTADGEGEEEGAATSEAELPSMRRRSSRVAGEDGDDEADDEGPKTTPLSKRRRSSRQLPEDVSEAMEDEEAAGEPSAGEEDLSATTEVELHPKRRRSSRAAEKAGSEIDAKNGDQTARGANDNQMVGDTDNIGGVVAGNGVPTATTEPIE